MWKIHLIFPYFMQNVYREGLQELGSLDGWTISYPEQLLQRDGVNCGVFVCTVSFPDDFIFKMFSIYMYYLYLWTASFFPFKGSWNGGKKHENIIWKSGTFSVVTPAHLPCHKYVERCDNWSKTNMDKVSAKIAIKFNKSNIRH